MVILKFFPAFGLAALMFRIDLSAFGGGFESLLNEVIGRPFLDGLPDIYQRNCSGQITLGPILMTAALDVARIPGIGLMILNILLIPACFCLANYFRSAPSMVSYSPKP